MKPVQVGDDSNKKSSSYEYTRYVSQTKSESKKGHVLFSVENVREIFKMQRNKNKRQNVFNKENGKNMELKKIYKK